jgi:hypothetical protein
MAGEHHSRRAFGIHDCDRVSQDVDRHRGAEALGPFPKDSLDRLLIAGRTPRLHKGS